MLKLLPVLLTLFVATAVSAAEGTPEVRPETWMESLPGDLASKIRLPSGKISDALFDWLDDYSLLKTELWETGVTLNLRSQRRVFDNQDTLNTWTVVDRMRVETQVPVFSTEILGGPLGFSIGTGQALEIVDIRQSNPLEYRKLPSLKERNLEFDQASTSDGTTGATDAPNAGAPAASEGGPVWDIPTEDPQDQARFGKIWNRLLAPLRLPLTPNAVKRLVDGEVISYAGEGSVQLGPSVGWSYDNALVRGTAGFSVSTFLKGTFRISILKESARFVRLKLTRESGFGGGMSGGASFDPRFLDGILLVKQLGRYIKVTPFQFTATVDEARSFNVGYRYDLENPRAREAYRLAVLGQLGYSDELAIAPDGQPLNPAVSGVEKLFTRASTGEGSSVSRAFRLGVIVRLDHTTSHRSVDTVITFPDGTWKIFQSWSEDSREWRLFWAWYEKFRYKFQVLLDSKSEVPGFPLTLWAEGEIQDTSTSRDELMAYILATENAVGKFGIFPRPPRPTELQSTELVPPRTGEMPLKPGWRSSFFYRVAFSPEQVRTFVETSDADAWRGLEQAFQVKPGSWSTAWGRFWKRLGGELLNIFTFPLYIADVPLRLGNIQGHASRIHSRWMAVKSARDPRDMTERLGGMFYDTRYSHELMRLLRASLDGQPAAYEVSGYSPTFGRVAETGNSQVFLDDIATRAQREADFDRESGRLPSQDREAAILALDSTPISSTRVDVALQLKSDPKAIYLELYSRGFWGTKKVANVLLYNSGELQSGVNLLALNAQDSASPWFGIAKALAPKTKYRLRAAVNVTGLSWGPSETTEFTTP